MVILLITLIISCLYRFKISDLGDYKQVFSNTITVVSIFIGILMSMMGFLLTVTGKSVNVGVHKMILNYFLIPIFVGMFIVLLSTLLSIIVDKGFLNERMLIALSIIWINSCIYYICGFLRIIILMYLVLIQVFEEISREESDSQNVIQLDTHTQDINFDDPNMYD